jgi:hypothetical protein
VEIEFQLAKKVDGFIFQKVQWIFFVLLIGFWGCLEMISRRFGELLKISCEFSFQPLHCHCSI